MRLLNAKISTALLLLTLAASPAAFSAGNASEGDGRVMDQQASNLLDSFCEPHCAKAPKTHTDLTKKPQKRFAEDAQEDLGHSPDESGSG